MGRNARTISLVTLMSTLRTRYSKLGIEEKELSQRELFYDLSLAEAKRCGVHDKWYNLVERVRRLRNYSLVGAIVYANRECGLTVRNPVDDFAAGRL